MKKIAKILIVLLCLLISSAIFYLGLKKYREKSENIINNQEYLDINTENILNSEIYDKEFIKEEINDNLRKEFIDYTEENLGQLTPFSSNYQSEWTINRFSFVNNNNFYVEYNDNHALGRILVYCVKSNETINCSKIAYFASDNFVWEIDEGSDPFIGRNLQYYEKNEDEGWLKTYKSTEIFYFPVSHETLLGMQKVADNEVNLWRLNPLETVKRDIASIFRYNLEDLNSKILSENKGEILLEVSHKDSVFEVFLNQPVKKGEGGIWIIQYLKFMK